MKKTMSLFLALLIALSGVLTGCGERQKTEEEGPKTEISSSPDAAADPASGPAEENAGEAVETEEGLLRDELPDDLDFDGETITIHIRDGDNHNPTRNCIMEMTVEELNGELLNDAIYNRNIAVSERLNVTLDPYAPFEWSQYGQALSEIRASIRADEDRFDIVAGWCNSDLASLALENCFLDMKDAPYIDTEKPWWNQALLGKNLVGDKLYFLTGESNILSSLGSAFSVFVNEALETDFQLGKLSDYVDEGTWTIDRLAGIAEQIHVDLNGDGKMDSDHDRYGVVLIEYLSADALYASLDLHQIEVNDEGVMTYAPDEERIHTALEKIYNLFYNNEGSVGWAPGYARNIFVEKRTLMTIDYIEASREEFREMEDSYYIIPTPKFDEEQEQYYAYIFNNLTVLSVPVTNRNTDAAYATMEALSSESYFNVTPVFFNDCMQNKYARSDTTTRMLEIIRSSCYVDYEYIYGRLFSTPAFIVRDLILNRKSDTASWFAGHKKMIEKQLAKAMDSLGG